MSTTTTLSSSVPSRPRSGYERSEEDPSQSPPLALIAGITGSVVLLFIIVIVFLVYRWRHLKRRPRESASSSKENNIQVQAGTATPQTNTAFENDGTNVYQNLNNKTRETDPYTTAYTVPQSPTTQPPISNHFYAPLNIPERKNIYESRNNQEVLYEVVESPKSEAPLQSPGSSSEEPLVLRSFKSRCYEESPKRPTSQCTDESQGSGYCGTNYAKGHPGGPVYSTLEEPYLELISDSNCPSELTYKPVYTTVKEDD